MSNLYLSRPEYCRWATGYDNVTGRLMLSGYTPLAGDVVSFVLGRGGVTYSRTPVTVTLAGGESSVNLSLPLSDCTITVGTQQVYAAAAGTDYMVQATITRAGSVLQTTLSPAFRLAIVPVEMVRAYLYGVSLHSADKVQAVGDPMPGVSFLDFSDGHDLTQYELRWDATARTLTWSQYDPVQARPLDGARGVVTSVPAAGGYATLKLADGWQPAHFATVQVDTLLLPGVTATKVFSLTALDMEAEMIAVQVARAAGSLQNALACRFEPTWFITSKLAAADYSTTALWQATQAVGYTHTGLMYDTPGTLGSPQQTIVQLPLRRLIHLYTLSGILTSGNGYVLAGDHIKIDNRAGIITTYANPLLYTAGWIGGWGNQNLPDYWHFAAVAGCDDNGSIRQTINNFVAMRAAAEVLKLAGGARAGGQAGSNASQDGIGDSASYKQGQYGMYSDLLQPLLEATTDPALSELRYKLVGAWSNMTVI